jgi:hypothetical protein
VLGAAVIAVGFWPGIMIDDTRWQYQQSVDNSYEDWHPPLMAWIWRQMMFIQPGPAPMFLLQLALYWVGIGLVAYWAYRSGRPRLAVTVALAGWLPAPFALTGTVTKDCLMAGALGCATGLLLIRDLARARIAYVGSMIGAVFLILFAAALRLNAVIACLPLLLVAIPKVLTRTKLRLSATAMISAMALFAIGPLINALVDAEHTDVSLSLIIFDLGGITEHSGVSQFPAELRVRDPVAVNHRCYDPGEWDSYSSWAKVACPLGFEPFENVKDENDLNPTAIWIRSILRHPLAYAEHRATHFNLSADFLVRTGPAFTSWSQSVENPWGFRVHPNPAIDAVTLAANAAARTPIGWPIVWIGVALAALVSAWTGRMRGELLALSASAFLYGLSFLVFGVAVGMRYYFWTIGGAALAVLIVGSEMSHRKLWTTKAMVVPISIAGIPTALAVLARLIL